VRESETGAGQERGQPPPTAGSQFRRTDVVVALADVVDDLRLPLRGRRPAHALAEGDEAAREHVPLVGADLEGLSGLQDGVEAHEPHAGEVVLEVGAAGAQGPGKGGGGLA
jgi:hypothetical protein